MTSFELRSMTPEADAAAGDAMLHQDRWEEIRRLHAASATLARDGSRRVTDAPAERGNPWDRLRRRKVVQWGLLYTAGAWGLLQGVEYVSDAFAWPPAVRQVALLAALVGLPIALVLAWYHGDRGEQRFRSTELTIIALLLLLGGGIFWRYERASDSSKNPSVPVATTKVDDATSDSRPSIAVLPFENRSRLEDDAYFVDGIHDDILTQLSKVSALRVISRTSVEQFRDTKLSMKAIAEQLGVTKILEGGVQRSGDRVRIHMQLIDAPTDAHVWAESYDRELTAANIFSIQSEVAGAIASALRTSLTQAEKTRLDTIPTQNLEAWEAYQLGKQRMSARTSAGLNEAEEHFRRAIALDPKFALAWVGLADAVALQTAYSGRPVDTGLKEAKEAVDRALELDANLAEAWASAGMIAQQPGQWKQSEDLLRRAIALNPNYATAHHWLSGTLEQLGRRDEALAAIERAVVLDPLSAVINIALGNGRIVAGRFEKALTAFRQAIEIDSTVPAAYSGTASVHAHALGRFDAALPWFEKAASLDPGNPDLLSEVAVTYWEIGDDAEAERWLSRTLALGEGTSQTNAVASILYRSTGDTESAQRHAERAADLDSWNMVLIRDFDLRSGDYATARTRYVKAFPTLFARDRPTIDNIAAAQAAIEVALVLQGIGEHERARVLLDGGEAYLRTMPRISNFGFYEVAIHTMRGDTAGALATLHEIARGGPRSLWRYYRDFDPALASIRDTPEFKAVFADIERDMAEQRARLAARPKDAPLDLAVR